MLSSLAIVSAYAGQGEEATRWAGRALAGDPPSPTVLVTARQARALGLALTGRAREAVAGLGELSPSHLVPEPFEAELMATRGGIRALSGDLPGAVEDLVAVIGWARAGSRPRSLANAYASLADVEYRLGRWDDGLAHADIAITVADDGNQLWELPVAHAVASGFHAGRGEWALAEEHVDRARAALATVALPLSVFYTSLGAARLGALRGDWEAVVAALATFRARGPGDASTTLGQRVWELLAEAWLALGRLEDAERLLARWGQPAFAAADPATRADVWRLRGELAAALGDTGEAGAAFGDAEAAAATSGSGLVAGTVGPLPRHLPAPGTPPRRGGGAARRRAGAVRAPRRAAVARALRRRARGLRRADRRPRQTGRPGSRPASRRSLRSSSPAGRTARWAPSSTSRPRRSSTTSGTSSPSWACARATSWRRVCARSSGPAARAPRAGEPRSSARAVRVDVDVVDQPGTEAARGEAEGHGRALPGQE